MGRWLNNRPRTHICHSDEARAMLRFRRMQTLQKFASVHASAHNQFPTERHRQNRNTYKQIRAGDPAEWRGLLAA